MTDYPIIERHLPSFARPLAWWLDGLAARPPMGTSQLARSIPVFRHTSDGLQPVKGRARAARRKALKHGAALEVASENWLSLRCSVPPVRRSQALRVLALDLAERTPFGAEGSYFDYSAAPDGTQVAHVVPKAVLQQAFEQAQGLPVRWLIREGGGGVIDLRAEDEPRFGRASAFVWAALLVALGLGGWLGLQILEQRKQLEMQAEQLQNLSASAAESAALQRRLQALEHGRPNDLPPAMLADRPALHALLEALTIAIPDDSYLSSLDVEGHELVLRGTSRAPEALVRALNSSTSFSNARFLGALSQDGNAGSRFEIGAEIIRADQ